MRKLYISWHDVANNNFGSILNKVRVIRAFKFNIMENTEQIINSLFIGFTKRNLYQKLFNYIELTEKEIQWLNTYTSPHERIGYLNRIILRTAYDVKIPMVYIKEYRRLKNTNQFISTHIQLMNAIIQTIEYKKSRSYKIESILRNQKL